MIEMSTLLIILTLLGAVLIHIGIRMENAMKLIHCVRTIRCTNADCETVCNRLRSMRWDDNAGPTFITLLGVVSILGCLVYSSIV